MQEPTGEWVIETQAGRCVEFKVDPSNIFDIGGGHYIKHLSINAPEVYIQDHFGYTLNPLRYNTWGFDITANVVSVENGSRIIPNQDGNGTTSESITDAMMVNQASSITGYLAVYGNETNTPTIDGGGDFPTLQIQSTGQYYDGYLKVNGHFEMRNAGLMIQNFSNRDSLLDVSGIALIQDSLIGVGVDDLSKANLTNHTILTAAQSVLIGKWDIANDTNGNQFPDRDEIDTASDTTSVVSALSVDLIDLIQDSMDFKDQNLDLYRGAFVGSADLTNLTSYDFEIQGNKLVVHGGLDASKLTASNVPDLEIAIRESLVGGTNEENSGTYSGLLQALQSDLNNTNSYLGILADETKRKEFETFLTNAIKTLQDQIKGLEDKKQQISTGGDTDTNTTQGYLDVMLGSTHTAEDKAYLATILDDIVATDSVIDKGFLSLKIDTTKLGNIMTSINAAGNQSAKDDAKKTFEMILGAGKGEYVSASITQMSKDTFFHDLTTALNTGNRTQNDAILTSLIGSSTNATIGMNAVANAGFFKDLESIAHSHTNTTSEQSSANATINIANDMASVAGSLEPTTHTNSKCVSRVC